MTNEPARLILKRASASRPSGEWNDDDYDVLADGALVGRIFKANAALVGRLSYILHREPVVAGGHFRARAAVVNAGATHLCPMARLPGGSKADDPIVS
jgi:hypothetical protein